MFFYEGVLAASLLMTLIYVIIFHKHFNVNMTLIFAFIPIADYGYLLMSRAQNLHEAVTANSLVYLGGCYLALFIMFSIFDLCTIGIGKVLRTALFAVTTAVYVSVLTAEKNPFFYKSASFELLPDGTGVFTKEYGILHTVFYIMIIVYLLGSLTAMAYSYTRKKETVSGRIIRLLILPELLSAASFFAVPIAALSGRGVESAANIRDMIMPVTYVLAQISYLLIIHRMSLYNIDENIIDSLVQKGETGFIAFDYKLRYIGSNETAKNTFPTLREMRIDDYIGNNLYLKDLFLDWICTFKDDPDKLKDIVYSAADKKYVINISDLYDGIHKRGWYLLIRDDTPNQNYIDLMKNYNNDLSSEIERKTAHIVEMHDKLIVSMATMVESRDNSTGGHIRRTSRVVSILMDEIMKENEFGVTDEFCRNVIKAAPMHDLGKIAVDDAILRKPGRFTDDEFEKMKKHAAEGARIVHEIMRGTDDPVFGKIAENVAHYHHERWDGSGYPLGLRGEEIPLEARIMAVADVYDALVSKRVYKERMSFEKADSIIMDGMGKHFDKRLERYYVSARPALEKFYSEQDR